MAEKTKAGNNIEDLKDKKDNLVAANVEVVYLDHFVEPQSEALKAKIAAKEVAVKVKVVSFPVKDNKKIVKVFRQSYDSCSLAESGRNIAAGLTLPAVDGDAAQLWDFVSAKADQTRFQERYVALKQMAENTPEKATEKLRKLLEGMPEDIRKEAMRNVGLA